MPGMQRSRLPSYLVSFPSFTLRIGVQKLLIDHQALIHCGLDKMLIVSILSFGDLF